VASEHINIQGTDLKDRISSFTIRGCISDGLLEEFDIPVNIVDNKPVNSQNFKDFSIVNALGDTNKILSSFNKDKEREETRAYYGITGFNNKCILGLTLPIEINNRTIKSIFILENSSREETEEFIKTLKEGRNDTKTLRDEIGKLIKKFYPKFNKDKILMKQFTMIDEPLNNILSSWRSNKDIAKIRSQYSSHVHISKPKASRLQQKSQSLRDDSLPAQETVTNDIRNKTDSNENPESKNIGIDLKIQQVETKDKAELEKIAEKVENRFLFSKFSGRMIINGEELLPEGFNEGRHKDYLLVPGGVKTINPGPKTKKTIETYNQMYTRKGVIVPLDETGLSEFLSIGYLFESCPGRELFNNYIQNDKKDLIFPKGVDFSEAFNLGYIKDTRNTKIMNISCTFPVLGGDSSSRAIGGAIISFSLPEEGWDNLLRLFKMNPDNLESFFELSFSGLDNTIARRRVSQANIIDIENFFPLKVKADKGYSTNPDTGHISLNPEFFNRKEYIKRTNCVKIRKSLNRNAVTPLKFSQPYPTPKN
jgi:hypothetical protein